MKNLFLSLFVAMSIISCSNSGKKAEQNKGSKTEVTNVEKSVVTVDEALNKAETLVNKVIFIKGDVSHTCKHSGRRCFIVGSSNDITMRVEAGGKINGFNRELVGTEIIVEGVLKESRVSEEEINKYEEKLKETGKLPEEDGSAETCAAERSNITKMRAWMKEHNKPYYATYYVNGIDFESVE